jgi:hypothetical protein
MGFGWENLKERGLVEDFGTEGRIVSQWDDVNWIHLA